MRLLRQLMRRKLRTTLTILGSTIGIWALVVFSSMANKINAPVAGGSDGATRWRRCAEWTWTSRPARWWPSWDRPAPVRAR